MGNQFTTAEPRMYNGVSSVNGAGRTGQPHAEEWATILYHTQKLPQNGLKA